MSSEMREVEVLLNKWLVRYNELIQMDRTNEAEQVLRCINEGKRALLARTEARAPHHPLAICPTCKDYYEVCECTPDAVPLAVAWVLAYPDGSISSFAAVYRRKENAEKHIASYGGSLGLVPMPLYTHPHDASGDADEVICEHSGCGHGPQANQVPVTVWPGDKVLMRRGRLGAAMQAKEAQ